jgi:hypothetical protein
MMYQYGAWTASSKTQHTNIAFGGLCVEEVMHMYISGKKM